MKWGRSKPKVDCTPSFTHEEISVAMLTMAILPDWYLDSLFVSPVDPTALPRETMHPRDVALKARIIFNGIILDDEDRSLRRATGRGFKIAGES